VTGKVTRIGAIVPKDLARMCEAHPAVDRVILDGHTYRVFPKDRDERPVFFSSMRFGSSGMCENTLRDLRKSGIDVERVHEPEPPKALADIRTPSRPKPTPPPQENDTVSAATTTTPTPRRLGPVMTRDEGADLREMVRASSDATVEMLAQADGQMRELRAVVEEQGRTLAALRREVRDLRANGVAVPSKSARIREAILAYLMARPGERTTPQLIELNIGDTLPEDRSASMVATACKELATAGKIQGGGTRDIPAKAKGIYWYEPPADGQADES
jgi:hypothetical protein